MNLSTISQSLVEAIKKNRSILIYVKGSPDPDAIACSFAFQVLCSCLGVKSEIRGKMPLSLQQNRVLVAKLGIKMKISETLDGIGDFDSYAVLDHPSNYEKDLSSLRCCVHIDHHAISKDSVSSDFFLSVEEYNSLSTFFAFLFREMKLNVDRDTMRAASTALLFGVFTDTDKLEHATAFDRDAAHYLEASADNAFLSELMNLPYTGEALNVIRRGMRSSTVYRNWIIAGVGYVSESNRDSIAIAADYLLDQGDYSTSVVFAIIERENGGLFLDASFRTKVSLFDLNYFIRKITPNGGARQYKGAYQVPLEYFSVYPDRIMLWDVVNETTVAHIIKGRDELRFIAVTDIFSRISLRIKSIFTHGSYKPFRD